MEKGLKIIDKKIQELYSMRPFSGSEMKRIREIFRIEYNYSSNHIEGNSLTMQETRSLLLSEIDSGNIKAITHKKLRDQKEMIGHDEAIKQLGLLDKLDFVETELKSELKISHKLIRDLNKIILVENDKKRVIDENGDQFFVDVIVGQYKTKNNHVKRRNGSIFYFADTGETQALMQDLIDWYEKNKNKLHPIVLATMFHYKFIRIHPFDDGNGRVCRLLINMILMHYGYPLFIVPVKQKDEYYDILEYMDGQFENIYDVIKSNDSNKHGPFIDYIAKRVGWSIDQMMKVRKEKKRKRFLFGGISIFILFVLASIVYFQNNEKTININNSIDNIVVSGNKDYITKQEDSNKVFSLKGSTCEFLYTGNYKYLDVYDGVFWTPTQKPNINQYTRQILISGNIEEVKICILADVRDDHKGNGDYSFEVKAYLGNTNNAGYINVGWYKPNNKFFDKDSGGSNPELYGRFDGNETPFRQVIDLEKVIVADVLGGESYKYIRPIVNFQKEGSLNIGAYVEGDSHFYAGKIAKFRIIYKGDGEITK